MCLYEKEIKNRRYIKNKKNGGIIPPIPDQRLEYVTVTCGKCIECRKKKAREWQIRLLEHIKTNTSGKMVTLTFSDQAITELLQYSIKRLNPRTGQKEIKKIKDLYGYEKDNAIATKAVRLFLERWRKEFKTSLAHWLVTELGHKGTENIHLHGIIWTNHTKDGITFTPHTLEDVERHWKYGFIWKGYKHNGKIINYVNGKTVNYITKYVHKIDQRNKEYKSKILTSPGIGANYITTLNATRNKFDGPKTNETYKTPTGHNIALPTYWRNKLYSDTEKEQLWLQKIDQQQKYIMGQKIDISKGFKTYNNIRQFYRKRNIELGYGTPPNEDRKKHEENRREQLIAKRVKRASGGV